MTTRGHSRKKRKQTGIKWLYITAAGLVCAVILAAILFKIRAGSMDSRRPAGTDASQEIGAAGDRAGDGTGDPPNSENQPDPLSLSDKTNADNTDNADIRAVIRQMSLEQKAAQLFIITPEALILPQLRKIAKDLVKNNWQEFLNQNTNEYFEQIMLEGASCTAGSAPGVSALSCVALPEASNSDAVQQHVSRYGRMRVIF